MNAYTTEKRYEDGVFDFGWKGSGPENMHTLGTRL
jgi:hypothetical protein